MSRITRIALGTTVLALAATPVTLAAQGGGHAEHGGGPHATEPVTHHTQPHHAHAKPRHVVAKGVIVSVDAAGIVVVHVTRANHHGGSLVGQDVGFDVSQARLSAADTNGDGAVTVADLAVGDQVVVKTGKLAADASQPLAARQLVDQTHPEVDANETPDAHEVPAAHEAPAPPSA